MRGEPTRYANIEALGHHVVTVQADNGDWIATIPALGDHLFRVVGDTKEEALFILNDVLPGLLDWLRTFKHLGLKVIAVDVKPVWQGETMASELSVQKT